MKEEKRSRLEEDRITNSCITRIGQLEKQKTKKNKKKKTKQNKRASMNIIIDDFKWLISTTGNK